MTGAVPALVVGGGPAGATTAFLLARGGIETVLLERQTGAHDVVCGGFLGWDALASLRRLGLDPDALGAQPITRLRLVAGGREVETALPRHAAGLSRRRLDEALLAMAWQAGTDVRRGVSVRAAHDDGGMRLADGQVLRADAVFLATGKHELRGAARNLADRGEGAVGLRASYQPNAATAARLSGVIELHPFDGGYAGILLQEDGSVNLCMSVAAARLRAAGGIARLLAELSKQLPGLAPRLEEAGDGPWLTISNVPYGWRARHGQGRLFRVGDQAAVIASLAGDGVAIALASGRAAAEAHLAGKPASEFQRSLARQTATPLRVAETLRYAAEHRGPRRVMMGLASLAPGLARLAARWTRVESGKGALSGR